MYHNVNQFAVFC